MRPIKHRIRPLRPQEELFGWVVPLAGALVPVAEAGPQAAEAPRALMIGGVQLQPAAPHEATTHDLPHLTPGGGVVASLAEIATQPVAAPVQPGALQPQDIAASARPVPATGATPAVLLHAVAGGGTVSASIARDGAASTIVSGTALPNGPSVATLAATGPEDAVIALRIAASDRTGYSGGVVLEIRGLPPGASLTAGHPEPGGAWIVPGAAVPGLGLIPGPDWFGSGALQVTAREPDGQQATSMLGFRVTPVADVARISGTDTGATREDLQPSASGHLHVVDPDPGEAHFTPANLTGQHGQLALAADGRWTYLLDNASLAVQALTSSGTPLLDRFTVHSADGTAHQIAVTIAGHDDGAVITGIAAGAVREDVAVAADGRLGIDGRLQVADPDAGEAVFQPALLHGVNGGTLQIGADGHWHYAIANAAPAVQGLAAGQSLTETFTVASADGTTHAIAVTVAGTNDAPVLTAQTQSATEDAPTLTGRMVATDIDSADTQAFGTTAQVDGFTLNPDGSYRFDPAHAAYQYLGAGQVQTLAIPVTATDGAGATATQTLTIALTGSNDAPTATATADLGRVAEDGTHRFTEADLLRLAGTADTDTADALHVTGITVDAQYGQFAREANGDWVFTPAPNAHHAGIPLTLAVSDGHATATAHATLDVTPVTDAASASLAISVAQEVLDTGTASAPGRIVVENLQAGAPLHEMTMEFTVIGQSAGSGTGSQGPVILNFGDRNDNNMLSLWNPADMKIGGAGNHATGINLADGQSHRITLTWDSTSGQLKVFDNGHLASTIENYHKGGTLPADGFMVLGQKWNHAGNTADPGWSAAEHYEGKIFNAAVGSRALTDDQVARAPLASQMHAGNGLLIDVRSVNGQLVDTAHGHALAPDGITTAMAQVDTTLTPPPPGALLHLQASFTASVDTDDHVHAVMLSGLPDGTVVSDGYHTATVAPGQAGIDVDGWNLSGLTAQLPANHAANVNIALTITTEGPDGTLAHAHADTALVMDPLAPAPLPPPAPPPADDHADLHHPDPAPAPDHPAPDHADPTAPHTAPGDLAHYLDAVSAGDPATHPAPDHGAHDAASYLGAIGVADIAPPPHDLPPPPDIAGHDAAHALDPTPMPDPIDHTDHAALIPVPIPDEEHHQQVHV